MSYPARAEGLVNSTVMPLTHILRKCTAGYEVSRLQEKINHLMYIHGSYQTICQKIKKELETLIHVGIIQSPNIGMEFSIEKSVMVVIKKMANDI